MAFIQQQRRRTQRQSTTDLHSDQVVAPIISDSDTDWHVISSTTSSPILFPSESESSFRPSDTERDTESDSQEAFLPSHDGTGTFIIEDTEFFSSDQTSEVSSIEGVIQNLNHHDPSPFVVENKLPSFVPTIAGMHSQELASVSADEVVVDIKFTTKQQKDLDR